MYRAQDHQPSLASQLLEPDLEAQLETVEGVWEYGSESDIPPNSTQDEIIICYHCEKRILGTHMVVAFNRHAKLRVLWRVHLIDVIFLNLQNSLQDDTIQHVRVPSEKSRSQLTTTGHHLR